MNQPYHNPFTDVRSFFRQRSALTVLVIINAAVWGLMQVIHVISFLYNKTDSAAIFSSILDYLAVPAYLPVLGTRPWTLITYMFLHVSIWHILFNMLWLFWFGKIFLAYLNERKLIQVYIFGGIAGAALYILAFNSFPVFHDTLTRSFALGASASVMAIVTAISFYVPRYTIHLLFLGPVKIIYLAIALFVIDFFMIPTGNAGGHLAHIGGAIFGFLYIKFIQPQGPYNTRYSGKSAGQKIRDFFFSKKEKSHTSGSGPTRPLSDEAYNRQKAERQKRTDSILDKISKGGYDSLTKEEKEFLFQSSGK